MWVLRNGGKEQVELFEMLALLLAECSMLIVQRRTENFIASCTCMNEWMRHMGWTWRTRRDDDNSVHLNEVSDDYRLIAATQMNPKSNFSTVGDYAFHSSVSPLCYELVMTMVGRIQPNCIQFMAFTFFWYVSRFSLITSRCMVYYCIHSSDLIQLKIIIIIFEPISECHTSIN